MASDHRRSQPDLPEEAGSFTAWPLIAGIGLTKLVTLAVVIGAASDRESLLLTGATILPWLMVGAGLVAAPLAWHWRLRRARRRRRELIRAEWDDEGTSAECEVQSARSAMTVRAPDHETA